MRDMGSDVQGKGVWDDRKWVHDKIGSEKHRGGRAGFQKFVHEVMIIIIIHLLGLAPAGWLAASDSGPEGH
jgi:hypothetical protein